MDEAVPNLRPTWRENVKDGLLILAAVAGFGNWIYGHAREWVPAAEFKDYQAARAILDKLADDRSRGIEASVQKLEVKAAEHTVLLDNVQKTSDRIEKLVERRR